MRYGARNAIVGKVTGIKKGSLMCQVTLKVGGPVTLTSVMTIDSLNAMRLKKGSAARAVVKGVNVLLVSE